MDNSPIPEILRDSIRDDIKSTTWEIDGEKLLSYESILSLSQIEKSQLKYLITTGTPKKYRKKLWMLCTHTKLHRNLNKNYYKNLITLSEEMGTPYQVQIEKDLKRSKYKNDNLFIESIRRILTCYSIRNSSIGYCQGFSFIVESIFKVIKEETGDGENIFIKEEETFWVFAELMEEILPINYYSELAGVIIDTTMVNEFLKKYFPVLGDFFTRNDFSVSTFIHKWLVTLFTENFKEDTTFLIWDFLFLEGNIVLIKTCLIVFCILKRLLLKNENNFEDLFIILTSETSNIKANNPTLLHGLSLKQFEFNEEYLEMTREMLSMSIVKGIDEDNKEKFLKKNKMNNNTKSIIDPNSNSESNQIKCNVKWPICYQEEIIDKPITVKKFLILHHSSPTNYISDYFFDSLSQKKDPIPDNDDSYYDLLIERQKHSCYSSIMEKLKPQLAHHINKIINYSQSKEMEYKLKNNDSLLNENNKEQIYRRMSTKNDYVAARELINKSFKAKPYKEEDFNTQISFINK